MLASELPSTVLPVLNALLPPHRGPRVLANQLAVFAIHDLWLWCKQHPESVTEARD